MERCSFAVSPEKPSVNGLVLVRLPDGALARLRAQPVMPLAVFPGVFAVHEALVCVLVVAIGHYQLPIYFNPLEEPVANGLRAMARQKYAMVGALDGASGLAIARYQPPINCFAHVMAVLENAKAWTTQEFLEARQALQHSFDNDTTGLVSSIDSDANLAMVNYMSSPPEGVTLQ